jgi:VIT1/CCC1 family predicted Fe2+/Mn2+ transporter
VAGGIRLSYTETAVKIVVILFLVFIVGSLFSALYFLVSDKGTGERTVKALTLRITLSVVLFALLMLGYYFGFITGKPA